MPRIEPLDLQLTPEAKAWALRFLSSITDYPPTLTLMKSRANGNPEERWGFGAYGPRNIEVIGPELERLGHALLYSFEGLTVAIPQFHLLSELRGKLLVLVERRLVLKERTDGI